MHANGPNKLSRSEGFTLIELLVAMIIFVAVGAIAVPFLVATLKDQPKANAKSDSIRDSRALMESIGRDMRSGISVPVAGTTTLGIETYVHQATCAGTPSATAVSIQCLVTYTCTTGTCTRRVENPAGGGAGTTVTKVTGLTSGTVFTYSPSTTAATFVQVNLVFAGTAPGNDMITLTDGFSLRNGTTP